MSALHRVKTSQYVHDTAVRKRHQQQSGRDQAATRTHNAFGQYEARKQAAKSDMTDGGVAIHSDLIMQRLIKLNHHLWFEVSNADKNRYGIYLLDPGSDGGRQFICGMPRGMVREFTVPHEDAETGEVTGITPGWRNVLARLVRLRLIPEPRAVVMFGTPAVTSKRWQDAVG